MLMPTLHFRQVEVRCESTGGEYGGMYRAAGRGGVVTGYRLQQWWTPVADDGTPIAPTPPTTREYLYGEWRDVEIVSI